MFKGHLQNQTVLCPVVFHVHSADIHRSPQKKGVRPGLLKNEIKQVKRVSCVNLCLSAPIVQSAPSVANNLSVGGRLQSFWQTWEKMGANPRVVSILKEGYMLPFKMRPPLTRSPVVRSSYGVETDFGHPLVKSVSLPRYFQDGDPGNNPVVPTDRGVGNLVGLQQCVFPHPCSAKVEKVSEIFPEQTFQFSGASRCISFNTPFKCLQTPQTKVGAHTYGIPLQEAFGQTQKVTSTSIFWN